MCLNEHFLMKINQQYNGTIIGGIFTLSSLLLTLTLIVPVLSVIPGIFIESVVSLIIDNEPYSNVGKATTLILVIILILSLIIVLFKSRKTEFKNGHILGIMIFEYFIIHTLGLYIYWATYLEFRSDGQLVFGAVTSFPVSSFGFLGLGVLIDLAKTKPNENPKITE